MRYQPVARRQRIARQLGQAGGIALLPVIRQIAAPVLPRVQRAERRSGLVEIDDAVLLTGQADAFDLRIGGAQLRHCLHCGGDDRFDILRPLPDRAAREKGIIFQRFRGEDLAALHHDRADGGGADIQAKY